jgi:hypothetical protein
MILFCILRSRPFILNVSLHKFSTLHILFALSCSSYRWSSFSRSPLLRRRVVKVGDGFNWHRIVTIGRAFSINCVEPSGSAVRGLFRLHTELFAKCITFLTWRYVWRRFCKSNNNLWERPASSLQSCHRDSCSQLHSFSSSCVMLCAEVFMVAILKIVTAGNWDVHRVAWHYS